MHRYRALTVYSIVELFHALMDRLCTSLTVFFVQVLLLCSLSASLSEASELRTKLVLYPYHGLSGVDSDALASDLSVYLTDKAQNIYSIFATNPVAVYMADLHVENGGEKPKTMSLRSKEWNRLDALLLMDGIIVNEGGVTMAKSSIYLGELGASAPGKPIELVHLDLPLQSSEFGTITDTHSAATLYSIALDARRAGLPREFYIQVAARGLDIVATLATGVSEPGDLKKLKCGLVRLISEATNTPTTGAC